MSHKFVPRSPTVIGEEIHELGCYLDGLPSVLRNGEAFKVYEKRLVELQCELTESVNSSQTPKRAIRGDMKGEIWMADDFCDPIEDMKEYME